MASAAATKRSILAEDVPWRALPAGQKPIPKIQQNQMLRIQNNPKTNYAMAVMKCCDPIGEGLAMEARIESAGPDCIIPGLVKPVKVLGLKVWPVEVDFQFLEPVGRQLGYLGKFMDSAVNLMNASFQDR